MPINKMRINKIILLFFMLVILNIGYVKGVYVQEAHGVTLGQSVTDSLQRGVNITMASYNAAVCLNNVTKHSLDGATGFGVYNASVATYTAITTCSFSGNTCTISPQYCLNPNEIYRFILTGGSRSQRYDTGAGLPINGTYVQWTTDIFWNGASWGEGSAGSDYIWGIESMYLNVTIDSISLKINTDMINNSNPRNTDPWVINYNGTCTNCNTDVFNITFYVNSSVYLLYNINLSKNQKFNISTTNNYTWLAVDINALNYEVAANTGLYYNYFDTINPIISSLVYLSNHTRYYRNFTADNVRWNVTFSDANLYRANITLFYLNGSIILNHYKNNITGTTYFNSTVINMNTYPLGGYYVDFNAWDAHTKPIDFDQFKQKRLVNGYLYNDMIEITGDCLTSFNSWENYDRFSFSMTFCDNPMQYKKIVVKSKIPLDYIGSKYGYDNHFIVGDMFADFVSDDVIDSYVIKVSDHEYNVFVKGESNRFDFNSVGILNSVKKRYFFNISDSFYVFAYDADTNATISEFSVRFINDTYDGTGNSVNNVIVWPNGGIYSMVVSSNGYSTLTLTDYNITLGTVYNAYLNLSNAFTVYIRDQQTNALIDNQSVNIELIGTINSTNATTSIGYHYFVGLTPDDYIVRYSSTGYNSGLYYYTLVNGTNEVFTIYMLQNTSATQVDLYVINENSDYIENARIVVQRYIAAINSYTAVADLRTDFQGKANAQLELNNEFYRFYIYYNDLLKLQTTGAYIVSDEVTFQIVTGTEVAQDYLILEDVNGYVSYNPTTQNFRFYFDDPLQSVSQGCLRVYQLINTQEVLFNQTCVNSYSGTILVKATNITDMTYRGKGYITINAVEKFFDSFSYTFTGGSPFGTTGLLIVLILTILAATLFMYDPMIGLFVTPLPLFIGSMPSIGWVNIEPYYTSGLLIICIAIGIYMKK